jgi:hypothetical protein
MFDQFIKTSFHWHLSQKQSKIFSYIYRKTRRYNYIWILYLLFDKKNICIEAACCSVIKPAFIIINETTKMTIIIILNMISLNFFSCINVDYILKTNTLYYIDGTTNVALYIYTNLGSFKKKSRIFVFIGLEEAQ